MMSYLTFFHPKAPYYLAYMLQQVVYEPHNFIAWCARLFSRGQPLHAVAQRQDLVLTAKAKLLIAAQYALLMVLALSVWVLWQNEPIFASVIVLAAPLILITSMSLLTGLAKVIIVDPQVRKAVALSHKTFSDHKGKKIAVIGSYGKTTMKELLKTVLSEGFDVAATPGNMNVQVAHARFAKKLTGKEDVVIVEFGEGREGDVARMTATVEPSIAVITGLAPNHLDEYEDIDSLAQDLLSVSSLASETYASADSPLLSSYLTDGISTFGKTSVMDWKITKATVSAEGISFLMTKGKKKLHITSQLLGRHQIAPVALVAALADSLGMSSKDIEAGCAKTQPFEHRMQPRHLQGALLIDDTYNGNIQGIEVGLDLLKELPAKRKWYVTPGLVDQGVETNRVHKQLGRAIVDASPDIVVLMQNSVRSLIEASLEEHGFKGEVRIEDDPLTFYTNIDHHVVRGDVVLMQNDWTDNYN